MAPEVALSPLLSFENNPLQGQFVFSDERRVAYAGAIRSGKTVGACARILFMAQVFPGSQFLIGRKFLTDLENTTLKELYRLIAAQNGGDHRSPGPLVVRYDGSGGGATIYIRTKGNSSVLYCRGVNEVSKQLGMETSGYFLDQAEEIDEEVFGHISSRMSWWNAERKEEFKKRYGYAPRSFEILTCNPDPGWIKGLLFEQDDPNSRYFREPKDRWKLFETSIEQNRLNLDADYIADMRRTHSKAWVDRYLNNDWNIRGGAVYPEFNEQVHGVETRTIPAHWPRFISLDWGLDHYTAVYWGAVDELGTLWVYDELFVNGKVVSEVAKEIQRKTREHRVGPRADMRGGLVVWMDPATQARSAISERTIMGEFAEHGIYGVAANNDVDAGINKVSERLKYDLEPRPRQMPKVYIFRDRCPNLIKGLKVYIWQPPNIQGISSGKPVKKDDDAVDSFRYLVMAVLENVAIGATVRASKVNEYDEWVMKHLMLGEGEK